MEGPTSNSFGSSMWLVLEQPFTPKPSRPEVPWRAMDLRADHICVVCISRKPNVLFLPCGHVASLPLLYKNPVRCKSLASSIGYTLLKGYIPWFRDSSPRVHTLRVQTLRVHRTMEGPEQRSSKDLHFRGLDIGV